MVSLFRAWIIYPPLWGSHHKQLVASNLVQVPTRGQALFIAYIVIINVILCAVNIQSVQPNSYSQMTHIMKFSST